jgi:uncharacterized protein (DUF488 family)
MHSFCYTSAVIVYTVGHSTLSLEQFLGLLRAHGIGGVADVRRYPASRRHPHFAREALGASLARSGLAYSWLEALGGRRRGRAHSPHLAWRNDAFRAYADHMDTDEFRSGLAQLVALMETRATAILCAEAVPWRCHRQLVADALVARGFGVRHVLGPGPAEPHRLTPFARLDGERLIYDRGQLALGERGGPS